MCVCVCAKRGRSFGGGLFSPLVKFCISHKIESLLAVYRASIPVIMSWLACFGGIAYFAALGTCHHFLDKCQVCADAHAAKVRAQRAKLARELKEAEAAEAGED